MIKISFVAYILLTSCLFYIQHRCLIQQIDKNDILLNKIRLYKISFKMIKNDLELVLCKETKKVEKEKILNEEINYLKQVLEIENGDKNGVYK